MKLKEISSLTIVSGTFFVFMVHHSAVLPAIIEELPMNYQFSSRDLWKKSFFSGLNIDINPYDPIARVTGAEIWKRIFYKPNSHLFQNGNPALETTPSYNFIRPQSHLASPTSPAPTTTTTTTTTMRTTTTLRMSSVPTKRPIATERPIATTMNMTTEKPSSTPSTDQLLNCIDWLLEWLQTNSTTPSRTRYSYRNRNRNKFNYN